MLLAKRKQSTIYRSSLSSRSRGIIYKNWHCSLSSKNIMLAASFGLKFGSAILVAGIILLLCSPKCNATSARRMTHLSHNEKVAMIVAAFEAINRLNQTKTTTELALVLSNRSAAVWAVQAVPMLSASISVANDAARARVSNINPDPTLERDFQKLLRRYGIKKTVDRDQLEKWHLSNFAIRKGRKFLSELGEIEKRLIQMDLNTNPSESSWYYLNPIKINPKTLGLRAEVYNSTRVRFTSVVPLTKVLNGLIGLYAIKEDGIWRVDFDQPNWNVST